MFSYILLCTGTSAFDGGFDKIIVIADKENKSYFKDLKEVNGVIEDFREAKGFID